MLAFCTLYSLCFVLFFCLYVIRELVWHVKSIFNKALTLFDFDCEITPESIPGTDQGPLS